MNRMIRTGVTVAVLVALVAAGCTSGATPSPTSTAADSGSPAASTEASTGPSTPITLELPTWTAEAAGLKDWWPELIADFEAKHPGVTVELENVAFSGYVQTLTTRFAAGEPPDIVHVPLPTTTLPAWAEAGFLKPLDEQLASTDIPGQWPANQSAMTWGGKTYGVLLVGYGFVLFYDQALLDAAGVGVPTTPDELLAAAEATTSGDQFGFSVTADSSPNFIRDLLHFVTGFGAPWVKDGTWNLADPKVVEAVDVWRTLATKYAPQGTDINQKRQAYFDGKVAMMIDGPFLIAQARSSAPENVKPNLHVAQVLFPVTPGDASHGLAIPAGLDPEREALVWDFIQLAASAEWQAEYAKLVTSTVARPGADAALSADPDTAQAVDANKKAVPIVPNEYGNLRKDWADFTKFASESFHSMLIGDAATATVLSELQTRLEAEGIQP